jgi:NADH:ubiquinone reductase (non-electrogenic)
MTEKEITLSDGEVLPFGLCVWSTGVAPTPFVQSLSVKKDRGRLLTDESLRILTEQDVPIPNVYALGDCSTINGLPLAATAQVATQKVLLVSSLLHLFISSLLSFFSSLLLYYFAFFLFFLYQPVVSFSLFQGRYLAQFMNRKLVDPSKASKFEYKHRGMLAYVGGYRAVSDLPQHPLKGFWSWIFWRAAYLTNLVSISNKYESPLSSSTHLLTHTLTLLLVSFFPTSFLLLLLLLPFCSGFSCQCTGLRVSCSEEISLDSKIIVKTGKRGEN